MLSNPTLPGLPASPRLTLFRAVDQLLRADPTLKRVIKPDSFKSWTGSSGDRNDPSIGGGPYIRLTPRCGSENWWSSAEQLGKLTIDVELCVRGTCWDDVDSLWYAMERVFYPFDQEARQPVRKRLRDAGSWTGLMSFTMPAYDPASGEDGWWNAVGQMQIDFKVPFNSA